VQVRGLPLFKDETFGLGPHLHVFLDNEPYKAVYDLSEPLEFKDLSPGTHTLRVFASRPWHESFKNQGAFDQRTFHIYAPTPQDELSADEPVLTYSRPQGSYGAEPIMLDFYLTNAPLHMTAQEDPKDDIHDWRIRCTVNGQSFVFDEWQAVYLKGFEPGRNWVQLELIDEAGNPIDNRFNNTVRIIDYEPGGEDTLSKLVRGELALKEVAGIIDPTYEPPVEPEPEPEPEETIPADETLPEAEDATPETQEEVPAEEVAPADEVAPAVEEVPSEIAPEPKPEPEPAPVVPPAAPEAAEPEVEVPATSDLESAAAAEEPEDKSAAEQPQPETKAVPEETMEAQPAEPVPSAAELEQPEPTVDEVPVEEQPSGQEEGTLEKSVDDEFEEAPLDQGQKAEAQKPDGSGDLSNPEGASETQPQDDSTEPSTGNKLLERYKRWQQRRQLNQPEAEQPIPEPDSGRVDVFLSPDTEPSLEPNQPEGTEFDGSIMEMPELVEPYLTEPYLTEPRLDVENKEEADSQESDAEESQKPAPLPQKTPAASADQPFI
jgi:hypothetical protein